MIGVKKSMMEIKMYYQEFHHKCVTWYITVMGFFIAGTIAADKKVAAADLAFGITIILCSTLLSVLFALCIFHFSRRIDKLNKFLNVSGEPPEDWYEQSKRVLIGIHGIGSWFFLSIILGMQITLICLILIKYSC